MVKYLDYDGLQEFKNQLDNSLEDKVDKITGKGLSTNDFTTDLKNKLDNIEAGATANEGTVTGITIGQTDYIPINGQITLPDYPTTFGASGTNHSSGLVPDPGSTQGNTKYLREDGTWAEPTSGGTSYTVNAITSSGGTLSLDGTVPLHVVTLTGNVSALQLSTNPLAGHNCHVILTASSEYTVAIAHDSTNRICPNGEDPDPFTISAGGYVEIDFLNVNNKIYVRGI